MLRTLLLLRYGTRDVDDSLRMLRYGHIKQEVRGFHTSAGCVSPERKALRLTHGPFAWSTRIGLVSTVPIQEYENGVSSCRVETTLKGQSVSFYFDR